MLSPAGSRFGRAWLILSVMLGAHVVDEALTDFLGFYNPFVESMRARLGWWPMPTFTFGVWLGGLIVTTLLLAAMSRFAFEGRRWMRWLAYIFGLIMLLNGIAQMAGSVYFGRLLPGVYSSPFMVAAAVNLLIAAAQFREPLR